MKKAQEHIPADLAAAIAAEEQGTGPLSPAERKELAELRLILDYRGRLGLLNGVRLAHLERREAL